ncbi:MAG TPA: radical SAM protein [Polyangiaceae bacterium]|nr:radical SAM protein [Polyangiaceae bacterium]
MTVLLINPNREQVPWPAVPMGLCTVATAVKRAGHDVRLLDLTFSKDPARDTRQALLRHVPKVVGVTIRNIDNCNFEHPVFFLDEIKKWVVDTVREVTPNAKLVLGGSGVNVSPARIFERMSADYAVVGEGEEVFPQLLACLLGEHPVPALPGVLTRETMSPGLLPILDTGRMLENEPRSGRALVQSLERSVRSEAWRWVDVGRYAKNGGPYPIQTKRGCALKCVYCVYNNIEGHAYRLREPADVVDEIAEAVSHGVRTFDFVDSTFNLPLSHARALCAALAERKLGVELSTMGLNPAGVTEELVGMMKRAGFTSVMCTPESASDVTLKSLQKGFSRRTVERAARVLAQADLPTYWFFMLGAPGETMDTVRETLEFCETHIPRDHMVLFSTGIRVYAGTPLERHCKDTGWFEEKDPLLEPSWYLSPELDLQELYGALVTAAARHPNWMTNAETVLSARAATFMKTAFRAVGWRGAFWQHLPKVFRLVGLTGGRARGFEQAKGRMSQVVNLPHHR